MNDAAVPYGFALIDRKKKNKILQTWDQIPAKITIPEYDVEIHAATTGIVLVERFEVLPRYLIDNTPDRPELYVAMAPEVDNDGTKITVTQNYKFIPIDARRRMLCQKINTLRNERLTMHIEFESDIFQVDPTSAIRIHETLTHAHIATMHNRAAMGDYRWYDPDEDFHWIDAGNTPRPMDAWKFIQFAHTVELRKQRIIKHSRKLKDIVTNADTNADLDSIDITSGWPV